MKISSELQSPIIQNTGVPVTSLEDALVLGFKVVDVLATNCVAALTTPTDRRPIAVAKQASISSARNFVTEHC